MTANPKIHKCYVSNTLHTMLAIRENNEGFRFVVSAQYIYQDSIQQKYDNIKGHFGNLRST